MGCCDVNLPGAGIIGRGVRDGWKVIGIRCTLPGVTMPTPAASGGASSINWLSTAEAAAHLGITPRTLYRFIDEGQLPAYRFGRVIRLKLDEVDRFIETCRIEPGTLEHLYPEVAGTAPTE